MTEEEDEHAEIRKQISTVHDRVNDLIKGQGAIVRWALVIIIAIWLSILGYIYRIDVSLLSHLGASKTVVDRIDEAFDNIELTMNRSLNLNEKEHNKFRRRLDSCEYRMYNYEAK